MYTGSALEFTDLDSTLRPFTDYQYMLSAHNSAGDVSTIWVSARTLQAPPSDVRAPVLLETALTSSSIGVMITEPTVLNGLLERYVIYLNGSQVNERLHIKRVCAIRIKVDPGYFDNQFYN